jgi:hypothetical protein
MEKLIETLVAQGIDRALAESMAASFKPKKEKTSGPKKNGFFASKKTKVEMQVECTVICECCGATELQMKTVQAVDGESPKEMKLPVSSCPNCIEYFRAMTHEQLVNLALAAHNPTIRHDHPRTSSQVKLAKRLTAEEVLNYNITRH